MPYGKKNKYFPIHHIHKLFISYATISYNVSVEKYIGVLKSWVVLNYKVLSCRMNQFNKNLFFSRQGLEILIEHSFHNLLFYLIVSILKVKKVCTMKLWHVFFYTCKYWEKTAQLCWTELKVMVVGRQKSKPKVYYTSKKSWPTLNSNLLYKMGQDFLDIQYVVFWNMVKK